MSAPTFVERKDEYKRFWSALIVHSSRVASVDRAARLIVSLKDRYQKVEKLTGVPWFAIGIIHMREASNSFQCCLCNGERIIGTGRKTTLVPAGRGPYTTWEASAYDELHRRHMDDIVPGAWSIERIAYELEAYNGWGYWWKGDHTSAYLWAGSSVDNGGKYVADHVFDANAQDSQNGAMVVLKRIAEIEPITIWFEGDKAPVTANVTPIKPPAKTSVPIVNKIDPQKQVGGLLGFFYSIIQSVLKRK